MTVRKILTSLVVALTIATAVTFSAEDEAAALDCAASSLEQSLEWSTIAFIGQQIAEDDDLRQTFRVDQVMKGDIEGTTIVGLRDEDWGGSWLERGQLVFVGGLDDDGYFSPDLCGNPYPALQGVLHLDGELTPPAGGTPAFVVSIGWLPGIVGAVLNPMGEVVHYAPGEGDIQQLAACPAGNRVATLRADPPDEWGNPAQTAWTIELRAAHDLALIDAWPIDGSVVSEVNSPALMDLECHTSDGSMITAIAPEWFADDPSQRERAIAGDLVVVRDFTVERTPLRWPRDATYDAATDTIHVVADATARTVTSIAADGTRTRRELSGTHAAREMTVHDEVWTIVSETIDVTNAATHQSTGVTHLLTGAFDVLESHELPINDHGTSGGFHDTPTGRWLHLRDGAFFGLLVDIDEPSRTVAIGTQVGQSVAIGEHATLVDRTNTGSGVSVLTGPGPCAIDRLIGGRAMAAIFPADPVAYDTPAGAEPAEIPPSTTMPGGRDTTDGTYPTTPTSQPPSAADCPAAEPVVPLVEVAAGGASDPDPEPTTADDAVEAGDAESAGTSQRDGVPLAAAGAVIAPLVGLGVLIWRRRR